MILMCNTCVMSTKCTRTFATLMCFCVYSVVKPRRPGTKYIRAHVCLYDCNGCITVESLTCVVGKHNCIILCHFTNSATLVKSLHCLHFENINCVSCDLSYSNEFHHITSQGTNQKVQVQVQLIMQQTVACLHAMYLELCDTTSSLHITIP